MLAIPSGPGRRYPGMPCREERKRPPGKRDTCIGSGTGAGPHQKHRPRNAVKRRLRCSRRFCPGFLAIASPPHPAAASVGSNHDYVSIRDHPLRAVGVEASA